MRTKDLISSAMMDVIRRNERGLLVATTEDMIKAARNLSSEELSPLIIRKHVERWERGWYVLEERSGDVCTFYKKHDY